MKKLNKRSFELFLWVILLTGLSVTAFSQNMFRKVNDFDGDGKADFAVTRNESGSKFWYILQSTDGFKYFNWGIGADDNITGDYDGDGKTDISVLRKEVLDSITMRYTHWIVGSTIGVRSYISTGPNVPNFISSHQDYDGDGRTDRTIPISNNLGFVVNYSSGGGEWVSLGATPIKVGDLTGDRKAEKAYYNSSMQTIHILGTPNQTIPYGLAGDEFVPADFDGDGKGDLTIFRQSNGQWWWFRSSDNVLNAVTFGAPGDIPVPADYDGDGKTDIAIWRPDAVQSVYWVYGSQVGVFAVPWGTSGDTVVKY